MKAVQISEVGGPEVMKYQDLPDPVAGDGDAVLDKSGVSWATIARIETGRANPRLSTINRLAEALDMDPRDLLPDSGKRPSGARKSRQGDKRRGRPNHGG